MSKLKAVSIQHDACCLYYTLLLRSRDVWEESVLDFLLIIMLLDLSVNF